MRHVAWFVLFLAQLASAQTKCEANINGLKIRTIYIAGDHYNAVVWAYKHIAENTCLTPVQDITKADAILELYDPSANQPRQAAEPFSVSCSSGASSSVCTDSEGNMMSTTCNSNGCSSYYGPNPVHAVGQALSAWVHNASYQGEARVYTTDHKLLWRSVDQRKDHWSDLWIDKVREGTNSPGCDGRNWSVSKDAHKYKNYRRWAAEKCGIEMPTLVSIDIKLQAAQDVASAKEQEREQMIENAKEAAEKQKQQ
ncbi:MAG TPA: hypothetical protein VHU44_02345 [Acidobacteriaceae bacterium]|jgi:hypothetical protein|nr:hypothetical protein [Acidobacteriaceae bacterium]